MLVVAGLLLVVVGALLMLGPRIPWLGRLPGDLAIETPRVRLYFPIVTCLVLSVLATLALQLFRR
jgi:uncharacterized membrane protein YkgB